MTGRRIRPITGAADGCVRCSDPVTRCTAPACTGHGYVHVRSRLHRCGSNPFLCAVPAVTR